MKQGNTRNASALRTLVSALAVAVCAMFMVQPAFALPDAGSVIGNQATATYTDASGEARTATSNLVETLVDQVAAVDLQDPQTKPVAIGGTVYFPHTVTNTGNGNDSFDLTAVDANPAGGDFDFSSVTIYPDADGDGIPHSYTPIATTPELLAGESFGFVVAATVPSTVTDLQAEDITVTAVSVFDPLDPDATDVNVDNATVTNDAVIDVTKAISVPAGPSPGSGPVTITLTYTNTGNDTATDVTLVDDLTATGGMTYVDGAFDTWSSLFGTDLTAAADGDEGGIEFSVTGNVVTAIIAAVPPGDSGTVSFQVSIDAGLAPGDLENIATFSYDPDGPGTSGQTSAAPTNPATYTVEQTAGVTASDAGSVDDEGAPGDDLVEVITPVAQGSTVPFENNIVNEGNGTDTFEIIIDPNNNDTFPAGTTFQVFQADPVTGAPTAPLTDTNGDGNPDTGPLAAGADLDVVIVAILPPGASGTGIIPGAGYVVEMEATSTVDPLVSDTVTNSLAEITANVVDLTNTPDGSGAGPGPEPDPVNPPVSTDPGETVDFPLTITNTDPLGVADSFDLSATLPAGWTVVFVDTATGAEITNTGSIPPGGSADIIAQVTVPPGFPASTPGTPEDVFFDVLSPTTGAGDGIHNGLSINEVHDLGLTPDNTGQVFPGGSVVYPHTLINNGNVDETTGAITTLDSDAADGWTSVIYWDANDDGVLDPGDPVVADISDIDDGTLSQGESELLFVKVFAPAGAVPGDNNSTIIDVVAPLATATATDGTTVITGDVELLKEQALDADCDGTPETAFTIAMIGLGDGAIPGACLAYRITASNSGSDPVSALVINDVTPNFTTYNDCAGVCAAAVDGAPAGAAAPANGASGIVTGTIGVLNPATSAELTFTVKINE